MNPRTQAGEAASARTESMNAPVRARLNIVTVSDALASELMADAAAFNANGCRRCGHAKFYTLARGGMGRCQNCRQDHAITNGTWVHSMKATPRQLVLAALLFCGARKGMSSPELSRALGMQQSAIYKLLMRFRNALYAESLSIRLCGVVEVDGAFFGGHVRHENAVRGGRKYRYSRRNATNRKVVVVLKQRMGRTLTFVGAREIEAIDFIRERLDPAARIQSDQSHAWDGLERLYETMRINHKFAFSSNQACTNNAESFFSGLRRMATGTHHKISGHYLHLYANEMAWRSDVADLSEEEKVEVLLRAVLKPADRTGAAYWRPGVRRRPNQPAWMEAA